MVSHPPLPIKPLYDMVILEPIPQDQTAGGILIPDGALQRDVATCRVIAVGPGYEEPTTGRLITPPVNVGDVVYNLWNGREPVVFHHCGRPYRMCRAVDLLAVQPREKDGEPAV